MTTEEPIIVLEVVASQELHNNVRTGLEGAMSLSECGSIHRGEGVPHHRRDRVDFLQSCTVGRST